MVERNEKLELALLSAQLNPHLLYNVLTAVQHTLTGKHPETRLLMNAMIDIFDLAMKGSNPDAAPTLKDELTLIEKLVFLHEELGKNCDLEIELSPGAESIRFPPKLLATLVENVFKHGDFSAGKPLAGIRLTCDAETLEFRSRNVRVIHADTSGNRIGLSNSRKRLNRSFPDNYSLSFDTDDTGTFTLHLIIKLK